LENYVLGDIYCRTNFIAGGVAIFVKNNLIFNKNIYSKLSQDKHIEISSINFKTSKNSKFTLVGLYRSPNGNIDLFFNKLEQLLEHLTKKNKNSEFLVVGDFNLNVLNVADKNVT